MYESGTFVAGQVEPVTAEQVQPNGVDLTLGGVAVQTEPGSVTRDGKRIGAREPVDPVDNSGEDAEDGDGEDGAAVYRLDPGGYVLEYGERIAIPDDHVGFVYPRSSLMRNSCMLNTAVWDAGYEGRGEGLLQVHHPVELEAGARVAQLVLAAADHDGTYQGSYQGERL